MNNRRRHTQTLTYWAPASENDYGEEAFAAPVVVPGRWEERHDQVVSAKGDQIVSKAFAYSDVAMAVEGYVALGDYTGQANPHLIDDAEIIKGIIEVPSLRTNTVVRAAIL